MVNEISIYRQQLEAQPWWKTKANTVSSIIGVVAAIIATVIDSGLITIPAEYWPYVTVGITAITTLVISKTKNGRTRQGLQDLNDSLARHIDRADLCGGEPQ